MQTFQYCDGVYISAKNQPFQKNSPSFEQLLNQPSNIFLLDNIYNEFKGHIFKLNDTNNELLQSQLSRDEITEIIIENQNARKNYILKMKQIIAKMDLDKLVAQIELSTMQKEVEKIENQVKEKFQEENSLLRTLKQLKIKEKLY